MFVIEAASRMAGAVCYLSTSYACEWDYMKLALDSILGKKIIDEPKMKEQKYVGRCFEALPCVFDHVERFEKMVDEGIVLDGVLLRTPGDHISIHI